MGCFFAFNPIVCQTNASYRVIYLADFDRLPKEEFFEGVIPQFRRDK